MGDLLKEIGTVLGTNVVAAVVVVLCAYYCLVGVLRALSTMRDHRLNLTALDAVKRRYEITKLVYEIEALKKQHTLQVVAMEERTARISDAILSADLKPDVVESIRLAVVERGANFAARHRLVAYMSLYAAHIVLRGVATAFLMLLLMFQVLGGPPVRWQNAFPLAIVLVAGFVASNAIVAIGARARLRDPIGVTSYGAGALVAFLLYVSGLYPEAL